MIVRRLHILLTMILSAVVLTGCSDTAQPVNIEPELELIGATDITRTEAVLSARVLTHGTQSLTHIAFHYGETDADYSTVPVSEADDGSLTCWLTGLRPGTSYSWYVEGGTATATLRTSVLTFTTQPNDLPAVSRLIPLSTGPVGVIVSFDITDDGGEPIIEAGCEVTDNNTHETTRVYLSPQSLTEGTQRLDIGGLSMRTVYTITPFAANTVGESTGEPLEYTTPESILLDKPGSLAQLFAGSTDIRLEKLTIAGDMNGDDFRFLRQLLGAPVPSAATPIESAVTEVDLTDVNITAGGATYDGSRYTVDNELTAGLFADCVRLRLIHLPATATVLARNAFARCTSLGQLTVSADIVSVLPSEDCPSLSAIGVSAANRTFASVDGVLFDRDVTEILWFPLGKTGAYTLPGSVKSIGERAFYGTKITSLDIPPSVTSISRGAFAGSQLVEISLPDNITIISEGMFQDCASLTTLRWGKGTEYVGNYVFDGTALTDLYVAATLPPVVTANALVNRDFPISGHCTLHVPAGSKAVYRNNSNWSRFSKIVEF